MSLEGEILYSARDGNLQQLRLLLDHKLPEAPLLVSTRTNDSTPLLLACTNGHLNVVLYLIEKCRADIEQVGSVVINKKVRIDEATPLWCAATAGHLDIVKYLIKCNAFVNRASASKCTPLRSACDFGHFEIAQCLIENGANFEIADTVGHTCLMIACFTGHYEIAKYLIECGADVNKKSDNGNTALHDCAESGNIDILKLLLKNGATLTLNSFGMSPLLYAALNGQAAVVEYFMQEFNCTKHDKINTLELLGATCIDEMQDRISALYYWELAMVMRYEDRDFPIEKPRAPSVLEIFVGTSEVRTLQELEELASNPDKMRMQALLVRDRILGPAHPDNLYYIERNRKHNFNIDRYVRLWQFCGLM